MRRLALLLAALGLLGCEHDPVGTYDGTASTGSQISVPGGEPGVVNAHGGSNSADGSVAVRRLSDSELEITLTNGCALRLTQSDPLNAAVAPDQQCTLREGPYEGPFGMDGTATFDESGGVQINVLGSIPQPSQSAGTWSYDFTGQRG